MIGLPRTTTELESVRNELEEIDRTIVLLVAARIDAAGRAIRIRSGKAGPVSDPAQEDRVIARARQWAEEAGFSPELAGAIFRAVVDAGKERFATVAGPAGLRTNGRASRDVRSRTTKGAASGLTSRART